MVDQELSLFHDTAPILSITELETSMPGLERLWLAEDSDEWLAVLKQTYGQNEMLNPNSLSATTISPSLCDLFQDFLHDNISRRHGQLSALELKLLLHPLQSFLCHLRQVISCFSDDLSHRRGTMTVTMASSLLRLEEVKSLLQKWFEYCSYHLRTNPECPVTRENLVFYHLISLNAVTSFPEMERLARREDFGGSVWELSARHKRCIYQSEEAIVHCGQVLRLVASMPKEDRPNWWSAAIYRATITLWVDSLSRLDPMTRKHEQGDFFVIDAVTSDHLSVSSYLWNGEGIPVLTNRGGGYVQLEKPDAVLTHCIRLLDEGVPVRMSDGIGRKLKKLFHNWYPEISQDSPRMSV